MMKPSANSAVQERLDFGLLVERDVMPVGR